MNKTSTLKVSKSNSAFKKSRMEPHNEENEPSARVISAILNYSKALSVHPSKHIKHVELILN